MVALIKIKSVDVFCGTFVMFLFFIIHFFRFFRESRHFTATNIRKVKVASIHKILSQNIERIKNVSAAANTINSFGPGKYDEFSTIQSLYSKTFIYWPIWIFSPFVVVHFRGMLTIPDNLPSHTTQLPAFYMLESRGKLSSLKKPYDLGRWQRVHKNTWITHKNRYKPFIRIISYKHILVVQFEAYIVRVLGCKAQWKSTWSPTKLWIHFFLQFLEPSLTINQNLPASHFELSWILLSGRLLGSNFFASGQSPNGSSIYNRKGVPMKTRKMTSLQLEEWPLTNL